MTSLERIAPLLALLFYSTLSDAEMDSKIIGGDPITESDFHFLVAIMNNSLEPRGRFRFASSLIHSKFALTSCHPLASEIRHRWNISYMNTTSFPSSIMTFPGMYGVAGSHNIVTLGEGAQQRSILKTFLHPFCTFVIHANHPMTVMNDLGAIEFDTSFEMTEWVSLAPFGEYSRDPKFNCYAAGWGTSPVTGSSEDCCTSSEEIHQIQIRLQPPTNCSKLVCRYQYTNRESCEKYNFEKLLGWSCAVPINPKSDIGIGDVGGPVVCGNTSKWIEGVIVSSSPDFGNFIGFSTPTITYEFVKGILMRYTSGAHRFKWPNLFIFCLLMLSKK